MLEIDAKNNAKKLYITKTPFVITNKGQNICLEADILEKDSHSLCVNNTLQNNASE